MSNQEKMTLIKDIKKNGIQPGDDRKEIAIELLDLIKVDIDILCEDILNGSAH